jgi:hypothetical protein
MSTETLTLQRPTGQPAGQADLPLGGETPLMRQMRAFREVARRHRAEVVAGRDAERELRERVNQSGQ